LYQPNFIPENQSEFVEISTDSSPHKLGIERHGSSSIYSFEDDPPLLEDLGIEPDKIKRKFISIFSIRPIEKEVADYDDMTGSILVAVVLGFLMLLRGKVQFSSIYGFGLTGCLGIYCIINVMSKAGQYVEFYRTISIMGYSLLPFTIIAGVSLFIDLK